MIYYFSATGNSKYVAEKIATELNTKAVMINESIKPIKDDVIGIVSPTYFWGLPTIVRDFLKDMEKSTSYLFWVSTYGTSSGQSGNEAGSLQKFDAYYSVKMPDTWTPIFDLTNIDKVQRINQSADIEILEIIKKIKSKEHGDFIQSKIPTFIGKIYHSTYDNQRKTSHFQVSSKCIGCRLCEKKCPVNAIELQDKRPVWIKERCVMCLGCLHRCPSFAIQYGKNTEKHGQYTNPNTKM